MSLYTKSGVTIWLSTIYRVESRQHNRRDMIKIDLSGFDKLQRELRDAQRGLQAFNGPIASVKVDRKRPESVRAATRQMEAAIDRKIARYRGNPLVSKVAAELKNRYRQDISSTKTEQK